MAKDPPDAANQPDLSVLLAAARANPTKELSTLFKAVGEGLHLLARHELPQSLRRYGDSWDLTQDTFLKAHKHFRGFRGTTSNEFLAWLAAILRDCVRKLRLHYSTQRRDSRRVANPELDRAFMSLLDGPDPAQPQPDEIAIRHEEKKLLEAAIKFLAPELARYVRWFNTGMSYRLMGERMGISTATACRRCHRACYILKRMIEGPTDWYTAEARIDVAMSRDDLAAAATKHFMREFGRPPEVAAAAPGRVNLIGEHVDYNDGFVLPAAIERWTVVAAARRADAVLRLVSGAAAERAEVRLDEPLCPGEPRWANYLLGVFAGFRARGAELPGLDVFVESTVPVGGGLSSSAALEVAAATMLERLTGLALAGAEKALLAQRAEHEFAGVPCGIMDQFAAVFGRRDHLLLLDCRSQQIRYAPLADPAVSLLIIDTNVRHDLVEGEYARRRSACRSAAAALGVAALRDVSESDLWRNSEKLSEEELRCARHVVTEIARTEEAARALSTSDWGRVAELMYDSHASLRDDFRVSCPELDLVVETVQELKGVQGCRMTGGGFGGCAVALVRTDRTEAVISELAERYTRATSRGPGLFVTRPADGAAVVPGAA